MFRPATVLTACLLASVLLISGCEQARDPAPSMAESVDAAQISRNLDADIRAMSSLSAEPRAEAERAFGPRLRRDLDACRGTRYENKPLYLLAQWTMVHGGEQAAVETLRLVDRLDLLPAPAFRNAGRDLRVQALLRLGRVAEAKPIAVQLEAELPEFGALRRVRFHELVGQPAPALPGTQVAGGGDAPPEAFVLVVFLGMPDAAAESWLNPVKSAAGERVRIIAVTTAGDMLAAASVASAWGVEVRWMRQGDPVLADWRVPALPTSVLLGPGAQRTVVAVDVQAGQLAKLGVR